MTDATASERWLPISGYEGHYEVSDLGRVRSLDRTITCKNGVVKRRRGVVRAPGIAKGRLVVSLCRDGKTETRKVHQLVLEAFVGPRPPDAECCHWDDDFTNNRVGNLRWGTHAANMQDSVRNGKNARGARTHCPRGHPLSPPNLVPSELRAGGRKCLACGRAQSMASRRVREGEIAAEDIDMKALADLYYTEVVETGGRARVRPHWIRHNLPLPRLSR